MVRMNKKTHKGHKALTRWEPWAIEPLGDVFSVGPTFGVFPHLHFGRSVIWEPRMDIHETKDKFMVEASLPGVDKKDIAVRLEADMLTIRGERREEREEKKGEYYCREQQYGRFERCFTLPGYVDADKVETHFANGVLKLTLPKRHTAMAKAKRIEIK